MTKLTILGSGTCNINPEKAAASVLIERDGSRLVYDFGRGVASRLVEAGLVQDDVEHVFLSHFHPDHVSDLIPYLQAASWSKIDKRTKDLHIYGQPGLKDFYAAFTQPYGDHELGRGFSVHLHEVEPGKTNNIAEKDYEVVDLHHAFGLRFDGVSVAGDANVSQDLIALLKECEVGIFDSGHITDEEIVELAVATQGGQLVCSHQYRALDAAKLNAEAKARNYTGTLVVASDLQSFLVK